MIANVTDQLTIEVYKIAAHHRFYDNITGCGKNLTNIFVECMHCDSPFKTDLSFSLFYMIRMDFSILKCENNP